MHKGQREAALSLGLRPRQVLSKVILPQALRVMMPPLTSQYLNIIKSSSLGAAVAYPELFQIFAGTVLQQTAREIETMVLLMAIFLSINLAVSALMNWYNRRVALVGAMSDAAAGQRLPHARATSSRAAAGASRAFDWLRRNLFSSVFNTVADHCGRWRSRRCVLPPLFAGRSRTPRSPASPARPAPATAPAGPSSACGCRRSSTAAIQPDQLGALAWSALCWWRSASRCCASRSATAGLWVLLLLTRVSGAGGVLLWGGVLGLPYVDTKLWGGLMLDVIVSFVTVAGSLPLGILLALGRRSAAADRAHSARLASSSCGAACRC